ncbi:MAG: hypothetical protein HYY23_21525 [Verrucomicrobia bacterium]|nr:hypothetical protein [Verrucomicrobiota bacterium]
MFLFSGLLSALGEGGPKLSEESLLWDKSINLRGGFGFKDNVLLSPTQNQSSPFSAFGFDAMLIRLPINGPQFYVFLSGDDYRYLEEVGVDKEQTFIATSKLQVPLGQAWETGLELQYIFQNQVFDVSTTESDLTTIRLKGHGIKGTPFLARKFSEAWRLQLDFPVTRQYLLEPLDDYWDIGPKLALERRYGHRSSISMGYAFDWRLYDRRAQLDSFGALQRGTSLDFHMHQFELVDRHYWDEKRRWRSDTKLGFEQNADNGSGFFDYHRYQLTEQLRYTTESWMLRGQVRLNFYDYQVQRVDPASAEKRHLTTLTANVRAERKLLKKLRVFAEYEHERNLSNRESNEYSANMVLGGLDWEL